jgi:hypothetical protein
VSNQSVTEPAPTRGGGRRFRDMAISLIVLLIPLAAFVAIFRLRGGEDVVVVDPATAVAQAQSASAFPVAPPRGLDEAWRPVSAVFQPKEQGATLRIGYLTPTGAGVQLIESSEPVDPLLIRELGDQVRPLGVVTVGARTWDHYEVRGGERALVAKEPGRTLIVVGAADVAELEYLAAAVD